MTIHNRYLTTLASGVGRVACTCGWQSDVIDDSKMYEADYYGIKEASDAYGKHLVDKIWNRDTGPTLPITCPRCQYGFTIELPVAVNSDFIFELTALLRKYGVAQDD